MRKKVFSIEKIGPIDFVAPTTKKTGAVEKRPCHFRELFVTSKGEVYPCCRVWSRKDLMLGHITDRNIMEKIGKFNPPYCSCNRYEIRGILPKDSFSYNLLNCELSLACQASCAMCCVGAPEWKGSYGYYDDLKRLIEQCKPRRITVQGGEVLIQRESLRWIEEVKTLRPSIWFHLITNGNSGEKQVERIEQLFSSLTISIVGFQPETYRKIMGMDFKKTINFAETIVNRRNVSVNLKYLLTPINYHEANLFLQWALSLVPDFINLTDAGQLMEYMTSTPDNYWKKIINRTHEDVRKELLACDKLRLKQRNTEISISNLWRYGITPEFIRDNGFENIIKEWDS